jgi:DEAD/DEAH box helicase domain-containing protein
MYERAPELVDRARALIERCPCKSGCPACVGPSDDSGLRKRIALDVLGSLELRIQTPLPASVA